MGRMSRAALDELRCGIAAELDGMRVSGLEKRERVIASPQGTRIALADGRTVLNLCANDYLGLASHPAIVAAAHRALDEHGFGMASVRFICGTQDIHQELEAALSEFLGTEATILFSSCFDANAGIFETLLGDEDAVISDELNHASIIDGIRLCKARRLRYRNRDAGDLERCLSEARGARRRLIVTDGVFSMDGHIADLPAVCEVAARYDALVMVDDSHAVGFTGPGGRGTPALHAVEDSVDVLTGTLGKALGGASGGYVSGRREIIDLLRQRSRPYLFSNTLAPPIAGAALAALELVGDDELRDRVWRNAARLRGRLAEHGLQVLSGDHPIVPVMLGDAHLAGAVAEAMLAQDVYVIAFSHPVVPRDKARIRMQVSAAHTDADLDRAAQAVADALAAHR